MPRARCPESIEAEKKYRSGMKIVWIAREMGISASTVRRWKSDQGWEK
ncbi:MAG: helix-turn-helix domain-containing protein, partial [Gracilibacteraceae bacterium]|nr:helix-turn-helix domain-containing protein [Synergistaceae bacterium]MDR1605386.1 helix-turn-helix domain-containing protein [Gracilibacteraceae bacterium]